MPFCHIVLHAQKPFPAGYPMEVKTVGDHIKRARLERRLSQEQVAEFFGVSRYAVSDWEADVASPTIRLMPKVVDFLGYVPYSDLSDMSENERIRACRKLTGLTLEEAARQLGVSVSTLWSWENGRGIKKKSYWKALEPFLTSASHVGMTLGQPGQLPAV